MGTRTTLDVLDTERELVLSQVSLINARHDAVAATYQLIATISRLTALISDWRCRITTRTLINCAPAAASSAVTTDTVD